MDAFLTRPCVKGLPNTIGSGKSESATSYFSDKSKETDPTNGTT